MNTYINKFLNIYTNLNRFAIENPAYLLLLFTLIAIYYVRYTVFDFEAPNLFVSELSGWWTWHDQSRYLTSAQAFFEGNFDKDVHWYPLGYPILGALFVNIFPAHPFIIFNTIFFLLSIWLFLKISNEFSVYPITAFILFAFANINEIQVFRQWVIPWNTTPVVFYVYTILLIIIRKASPSNLAMFIAGLFSALTPITRPAESILVFGLDIILAIRCFIEFPVGLALKRLSISVITGMIIIFIYGFTHYYIYGFNISPYQALVFEYENIYSNFWQRLYALMIDPQPIWLQGHGIAHYSLWWIIFPTGAIISVYFRNYRILAIVYVITINIYTYTVFFDMYPTGLWRFNNIHYFKISFPLAMLVAWIGLVESLRNRVALALTFTGTLILLSIQIDRKPVTVTAQMTHPHRIEIKQEADTPLKTVVLSPISTALERDYFYFSPHIYIEIDGKDYCRNIKGCRFVSKDESLIVVFEEPVSAKKIAVVIDETTKSPFNNQTYAARAYQHMFYVTWPRLPGW